MNDQNLNKKFIYYNLQEAQEEIEIILKSIMKENYTHEQLYKSFQHLYHHVNIAWNAREQNSERTEVASDEQIQKWASFPKDITIL